MFLTQEPHNIEDFLKSVNFVAPEGMNLKYFIVPLNAVNKDFNNAANENGFQAEKEMDVPGITDTMTFTKRRPVEQNAMATANFNPAAVPAKYPTHITPTKEAPSQEENIMVSGGKVMSTPNNVLVVESTERSSSLLLRESLGLFPKNTLFYFVREN